MTIKKSHWTLITITISFLFITMVPTWWGLLHIKEKTLQEIQDKLSTVLNTTAEALNIWASDQLQRSDNIASNPEFVKLTTKLIKQYKSGEKLLGSSSIEQMRQYLLASKTTQPDFHIILPTGINIASQRDTDLTSLNIIYRYRPEIFQYILRGRGQLVPPIPSDIALGRQKNIAGRSVPPTLFTAVPIRSNSGRIIAVFTERFDPENSLSKITALGRVGESGETYAFDKDARLLTSSRFEHKFFERGFMNINEQSPLALEIRDPGGELDDFIDISIQHSNKPFTVMAASAISGFTSNDMKGYRDYRGEWVLGSWTWLSELNIGLATEIEKVEALKIYNTTRSIILFIIFVLIFVVLLYVLFVIKINKEIKFNLIKSKNELEDKVNERTKELLDSESKLTISKELAEEANLSKIEFLASMSHEIRTPINGVMGMLGLLLNSSLTPDQERKAKVAQSSAKSLLHIINDILDFSKVEAGKVELEKIDFNIEILLHSIVKTMAFTAEEKDIELILDGSKISKKMVKGDPNRLGQIITNLINNAIKFTHNGTVIVRLSTTHYKESILISCTITDTGIGIPENRIDRLFNSFSQVDASTTREYGGTGLGLAICKKMILLMDGNIDVKSTLGKGSEFSFDLILDQSSKKVIPLINEDIKSKNILIIDDNPVNREIFSEQIKNWGGNTFEAESGAIGIKMCEQFKVGELDFIILDMQMPHMNGVQFTKILRRNPAYQHIKIIMMTSVNHEQSPEELRAMGLNGWFTKPVSPMDLHNSLLVASAHPAQASSELITSAYLQSISMNLGYTDEADSPHKWPEHHRILMVEDNVINQVVAEGILETIGLTCDIAENGEKAISMLKESPKDNPYTIMLMDCQMPIMDGFEATKRIRQGNAGGRFSDVTILAMTANAMAGDRESCLSIGMNDYISKPIDTKKMADILKKWIVDDIKIKNNTGL
jgi:signal transduction histidine kinase/DNA-binding response OmpR family regulator